MDRLQESKYRYLVPNSVTFLSLTCGIIAILAAANGKPTLAGLLILASYVLDLFDGELARRLHASTEFGMQLDSLVDMVSLGCAPAVLTFIHLQESMLGRPILLALLWLVTVTFVLAGAFRLARFNLLPTKEGQTTSVGLTISTGGATLALAVLSDLANTAEWVPDALFLPLILLLAVLMASRIRHPSITWVFSYRRANLLYLIYFIVTLGFLRLPVVNVWFLFNGGYLGVTLVRAGVSTFGNKE